MKAQTGAEVFLSHASLSHKPDFEHLADSLAQLIWTATPEGIVDYYNRRWYDFTGSEKNLSGDQSWLPYMHAEDAEKVKVAWAHSLSTGEDLNLEVRFLEKQSKKFFWFLSTARAARNAEGRIIKWYGSSTNIHQQKMAEQQVVDILEGMNDSFFAIDSDWNLSRVNSKMEATTRIRREDAVGKNFFLSFPMEKDSQYWINHHKIMEERVPVQYEEYYPPLDLWTEARGYPTADGGIAYLFRDITVERKALRQLEELTAELQEAIDARDRFLSIASHELRTPITGMKLQVQMMQKRLERNDASALSEERVTKLVAHTVQGLDRMNRLVEDMLDISRIQSGKLALHGEKADLGSLVQDVSERYRDQLIHAGIDLRANTIGSDPLVFLDRFRIEQVLTNLISNAIRYAPGAPVFLLIDQTAADEVKIVFQDSGPGIPPRHREKVFHRFERLVSENEISGLGLGLFIVREIVEAHGGRIQIEDANASGARFVISLPRDAKI